MKKLFLFLVAVITLSVCASAQTRTVKGTVVDAANDEPLIGVSVQAGTGYGAATDADGNFVLKVPAATQTLQVSYVGYKTQHVKITSGNLMIRMHADSEVLDEVIAVAYGQSTRAAFTGSAAVVGSATIENAQVTNPLNAIKGKVAGVQMFNNSGAPGADTPEIRIRGISSITAGKEPLIVVDGTPYSGTLNTINPNDIENMTVLKDAASNALYGARGANGVILVTTKSAKAGEASVTVDINVGANSKASQEYNYITDPAMFYETYYKAIYNYQYANSGVAGNAHAAAINQMMGNAGGGLGYNVYTVPNGQTLIGLDGKFNPNATLGRVVNYNGKEYLLTPDDWKDGAYKTSLRQEYNVAVNKGGDDYKTYLSAGYLNNEGITPASGYERFTARLNAEVNAKSWLKFGGNLSFMHFKRDIFGSSEGSEGNTGNPFAMVSSVGPIYPLYVRDANGEVMIDDRNGLPIYDYGAGNNAGMIRPVLGGDANAIGSAIMDKRYMKGNSFSGIGFFEVRFLKDFTFRSNNGIDFYEYRSTSYTNPYYGLYSDKNGSLTKTNYRNIAFTFQQLLNWGHRYGDHNVAALVGHEYYRSTNNNIQARMFNAFDHKNMELAGMISEDGGNSAESKYNNEGWFIRAQYDYADKYFASASYRRDASSRFHPSHRWGSFFSAGAAWIISKEDFMVDQNTWLDLLKLKVSYGEQGNDNIPNYLYTNQYEVVNSNGTPSVVPYFMGNENITWEKGGAVNAGVEFDMFSGRLGGSVEYFFRKTTDMLFSFPLPPSMGWTAYYANVGDMTNQGVEIDLNGRVLDMKDFTIDLNLNLTWYKNKISRLPQERRSLAIEGYEGYSNSNYYYAEKLPLYTWYMPKYAGVAEDGRPMWYKDIYETKLNDKGQEEVVKLPNGQSKVIGQETTTNYASATNYICGTAQPDVYGGFGANIRYKWFDLSVSFDYSIGGKTYDSVYASMMSSPTANSNIGTNIHADILNAWTPNNKNTNVPRYRYGDQYNGSRSDRFLTDASYLNLSNVTFGINLPDNLATKLYLKKLRLQVSADNVWLWSKRQGLDPRQSITGASNNTYYSPIRSISGGLNIVF